VSPNELLPSIEPAAATGAHAAHDGDAGTPADALAALFAGLFAGLVHAPKQPVAAKGDAATGEGKGPVPTAAPAPAPGEATAVPAAAANAAPGIETAAAPAGAAAAPAPAQPVKAPPPAPALDGVASPRPKARAGAAAGTKQPVRAQAAGDRPAPHAATPTTGGPQAPAPQAPARTGDHAAPAPPAPLARDQERFQHLVEGLSARLQVVRGQGGGTVRMTLRPESLGEVVVRLHLTPQGAVATLVTQNADAGQMLAQAAGELREALGDRGLQLERLDVATGGAAPDAQAGGGSAGFAPGHEASPQRTLYSFRAGPAGASTTDAQPQAGATDAGAGVSYLA
jgi:flagellar hook-length control protein FliK